MLTHRLLCHVASVALVWLLASNANAAPVTVQFAINASTVFDYASRTYLTNAGVAGVGSFTFDIDDRSFTDYGTTTITTFGGVFGTTWSSPVTAFLPADPYSSAYGPLSASYTFPNVSDYDSTFIEQAAAQANTFEVIGNQYSTYHIELRATRRGPSQGGTGEADYAFDRQGLLAFLQSFVTGGGDVYFNESFAQYSFVDGSAVYSAGRSYEDYSARIIGVIDHANRVSEPSSLALLILAMVACWSVNRRLAVQLKA